MNVALYVRFLSCLVCVKLTPLSNQIFGVKFRAERKIEYFPHACLYSYVIVLYSV